MNDILWTNSFRKNKSKEMSRNDFLRVIPFFEHLTNQQLKVLANRLHERRYEENEFLFEVNHPGAALFVIIRGEVVVETTSDPRTRVVLATLKAAEFLGELALLDQSPRSASARATKPTEAYALFRSDLMELAKSHPEIACEVYRSLAFIVGERLKSSNRQMDSQRKSA